MRLPSPNRLLLVSAIACRKDAIQAEDSAASDTDCGSPVTWYRDADTDGFGLTNAASISCVAPEGCPTASDTGIVAIFYGPVTNGYLSPSDGGARLLGERNSFGNAIRVASNLTSDGWNEVAFGAPDPSSARGDVYPFCWRNAMI